MQEKTRAHACTGFVDSDGNEFLVIAGGYWVNSRKVHFYSFKDQVWDQFTPMPKNTVYFRISTFKGYFYYADASNQAKDQNSVWRMKIEKGKQWEKVGPSIQKGTRLWVIPFGI